MAHNAESVFERDVSEYLAFLRRGDRIRFQTDNLTYAEMVRAAAHRRLNAELNDGDERPDELCEWRDRWGDRCAFRRGHSVDHRPTHNDGDDNG